MDIPLRNTTLRALVTGPLRDQALTQIQDTQVNPDSLGRKEVRGGWVLL